MPAGHTCSTAVTSALTLLEFLTFPSKKPSTCTVVLWTEMMGNPHNARETFPISCFMMQRFIPSSLPPPHRPLLWESAASSWASTAGKGSGLQTKPPCCPKWLYCFLHKQCIGSRLVQMHWFKGFFLIKWMSISINSLTKCDILNITGAQLN